MTSIHIATAQDTNTTRPSKLNPSKRTTTRTHGQPWKPQMETSIWKPAYSIAMHQQILILLPDQPPSGSVIPDQLRTPAKVRVSKILKSKVQSNLEFSDDIGQGSIQGWHRRNFNSDCAQQLQRPLRQSTILQFHNT